MGSVTLIAAESEMLGTPQLSAVYARSALALPLAIPPVELEPVGSQGVANGARQNTCTPRSLQ